jgi:hypothetical protein
MLAAQKAGEEEQRFQVVSIVDGKPVNLEGLAERIGATRIKDQTVGLPGSLPATNDSQHYSEGG